MGSIIFIILITLALIVLAIGSLARDDNPKGGGTEYLTVDGRCPNCGSPCKWQVDPETGERVSFVCTWCGDFK